MVENNLAYLRLVSYWSLLFSVDLSQSWQYDVIESDDDFEVYVSTLPDDVMSGSQPLPVQVSPIIIFHHNDTHCIICTVRLYGLQCVFLMFGFL